MLLIIIAKLRVDIPILGFCFAGDIGHHHMTAILSDRW